MKTIHIFIIFLLVVVVQLFVPAKMILNQESVIEHGEVFKFKTQPIDPSDPFKGKYINLNYTISNITTTDSLWKRRAPIYVYLETDSLGYAKIQTVSRTILAENNNTYVKASVQWYAKYNNQLNINFPFNRYYMKETKAYDAEIAVRNRQRDSLLDNTYALVYVKQGDAVLTDVLIDDIPIKNYVEKKEE
ncbi:hypothetical protein GCM10022291_20280 [Postechiella marina]|uniref:Membrane-anchored protein n=1 Tax=Postechiella marina TaxID=943941 RepID=A0ABP8CAN0_9FLAO